ncbi:type II toxin-antitoxin system PemK/MazF family toxin [Streptomyces marincola]|nr:type II toxin-antitoxin system PemK/MazF family toxin [Streptomyces marincola]
MAAAVFPSTLTSRHDDLCQEWAAVEGATQARRPASGGHMRRGEVWWADFDEQRAVVLLSEEEASGFLAMQVVAPAGTDLSGVAVEVAVGAPEGLPLEGVLRVALPRPGLIPCTWLVTLAREDLIGQAGVLPSAKLSEIEDALRLGGLK